MTARRARVLVVYKKSAYQLYMVEQKDPRLLRLLRARQPDVLDILKAHAVHQAALEALVKELQRLRADYDLVYRANLRRAERYDVVIVVGGDGTFLQASHLVSDIPMLGVNSDPRRSEAVFCAAMKETIRQLLPQAMAGRLAQRRLYRLQVRLNGRTLAPLALNDVLVAHDDPATMSRYRLAIGKRHESQKSSGVWIATASGSSSAILAAGGKRLAWTSKRFQYRPRELYEGRLTRPRLTGGVLSMGERVSITWLMRTGVVYLDGPHVRWPLRFGDRLEVGLSDAHPLRVLGLKRKT